MLAAKYSSLINTVDVVSFDVFDTLILRRLLYPEDIFDLIRKELDLKFDFRALRIHCEQLARYKKSADGSIDPDIYEIYREISGSPFVRGQGEAEEILACELRLECTNCVANSFAVQLFNEAKEKGKTVVLSTDMYLDGGFLRKMLEGLGISGYKTLLISSEIGKSKRSGSLYLHLQASLNIPRGRILHIGDNVHSDVAVPQRLGLLVLHYEHCLNYAMRHSIFSSLISVFGREETRKECVSRFLASILIEFFSARNFNSEVEFLRVRGLEWLGYVYFAPILVEFTTWLRARLVSLGIETYYFCSRDGYFLKELFELGFDESGLGKFQYFYVSRRSLRIPSVNSLADDTLDSLMETHFSTTAADLFERLGLNAVTYREKLCKAGISNLKRMLTKADLGIIKEVLLDLRSEILDVAAGERNLLGKYLHQLGMMDSRPFAIVDCGWHGSLQSSLQDVIRILGGNGERVFGMYIGLRSPDRVGKKIRSAARMYGFLSQFGIDSESACFVNEGAPLFELALYAPHGTVLGYRSEGDIVQPVLDGTKVDVNHEIGEGIQNGVRKYANEHGFGSNVADKQRLRCLTKPLHRLIVDPTATEANILGRSIISHEYGRYVNLSKLAMPDPFLVRMLMPWRLIRGYRSSAWKAGYLTQLDALSRAMIQLFEFVRASKRVRKYCRTFFRLFGIIG